MSTVFVAHQVHRIFKNCNAIGNKFGRRESDVGKRGCETRPELFQWKVLRNITASLLWQADGGTDHQELRKDSCHQAALSVVVYELTERVTQCGCFASWYDISECWHVNFKGNTYWLCLSSMSACVEIMSTHSIFCTRNQAWSCVLKLVRFQFSKHFLFEGFLHHCHIYQVSRHFSDWSESKHIDDQGDCQIFWNVCQLHNWQSVVGWATEIDCCLIEVIEIFLWYIGVSEWCSLGMLQDHDMPPINHPRAAFNTDGDGSYCKIIFGMVHSVAKSLLYHIFLDLNSHIKAEECYSSAFEIWNAFSFAKEQHKIEATKDMANKQLQTQGSN